MTKFFIKNNTGVGYIECRELSHYIIQQANSVFNNDSLQYVKFRGPGSLISSAEYLNAKECQVIYQQSNVGVKGIRSNDGSFKCGVFHPGDYITVEKNFIFSFGKQVGYYQKNKDFKMQGLTDNELAYIINVLQLRGEL